MRLQAIMALAVAVTLVTVGDGARAETRKRDVYQGRVRVTDGDTLQMGRDALRIWGVDAPEAEQVCLQDGQAFRCGDVVKRELQRFIGRSTARCEYRDWNEGQLGLYKPRAVVQCYVRGVDLGDWLVSRGLAAPSYVSVYMNPGRLACNYRLGLWTGAWANPADWRRLRENAPRGFGAQSGTNCRTAMGRIQGRMERYTRHAPRGL